MNIFYLDKNPKLCAMMHVDKHCVKMILEYAQLLSTAHRVLDGKITEGLTKTGRKRKYYTLSSKLDKILYSATHVNHPSAVWVRESRENYNWLVSLLQNLCEEYTFRYGRIHKVQEIGLLEALKNNIPRNISSNSFTEPTPAMPDDYKVVGDSIKSYHTYYLNAKTRMFSWKNREIPYFVAYK